MKIRMLTSSVGHGDKERSSAGIVVREQGQVYDVEAEEARRLLESGQAEPVAVKPVQRAERRGKAAA